jgi:formate hydrogenlyase subunit 3/multisubunit Na+/H+ antiporter MnhD subunit
MKGLGLSEIILIAIIFILGICAIVFWIKTLIQCIHSENENSSKIIWIFLMLVTGIIGSFLYNFIGSKVDSEQ